MRIITPETGKVDWNQLAMLATQAKVTGRRVGNNMAIFGTPDPAPRIRREVARRLRQIARGSLRVENGLVRS